ncbi:D-alanyl-D-alanine carboxypeptidase family protein [Demequina iriomotensis]|uniref:D-alanyl-D-alanine carboxypeptidase family protein n=1 Tax=Demequina iriomotensis TaxID=1536641 RepID=UPI000786192C|nr:D-alanyl-D-alanine carboxypeptidase family protein [Demequina iriomotensis]
MDARARGLARRIAGGAATLSLGAGLAVMGAAPATAAASPEPEPTTASASAEPTPAATPAEPEPEPATTTAPTTAATPRASAQPQEPAAPEAGASTSAPAAPEPAPASSPAGPSAPSAPVAPVLTPYDPDSPALTATGPGPLPAVTFADVSDTLTDPTYSPFAADIAWLGRQGVAMGAAADDGELGFMPDAELTRGEFAAYLYRLAGSPADAVPAVSTFADAQPSDTPYSAEIAWAGFVGIDTGVREGAARLFRPEDPLTRGAMAVMLHRFAGAPTATRGAPYDDVSPGSRVDDAAAWLARTVAEFGWDGEDGREFRPDATITRGAVAAVLRLADRAGVAFAERTDGQRVVAPVTVTVDGADALNLRSAPSLDAEVASWASDGDELETTGAVTRSGWVEVAAGDGLAWASIDYLAVDATEAAIPAAVSGTAATLAGAYANGAIPATALCDLAWDAAALLECGAAGDLGRLDAAFHDRFGVHVPVTSAYRDLAGQVEARRTHGWLAAEPGTSNHGWGEAIDLDESALPGGFAGDAYAWLVSQGPAYGWQLPAWARPDGSKPEPWHLEHIGVA